MQLKFTPTLLAIATAILSTPVAAISYEGYASTVSCSGSAFGCSDGGAVCCSLPTGYGYSVQFNSLAAGTQGQGYTGSTCSAFLFALFGPGTKCWNGGGARATHMNWFHSPQGRRAEMALAIEARSDTDAKPVGNCAPTFFKYEDGSGVERTIKVPADNGDAAETIAKLYTNKSFDALAAYEDYN